MFLQDEPTGSAGGLLKPNIELWLQTGTVRGLREEGAEGWVEGKQGSPKGGRTLLGRLLSPFGAPETEQWGLLIKCVSSGWLQGKDKGKWRGRDRGSRNSTHRNKEHMCAQALRAHSPGEGGHSEVSISFIHLLLSPFL